MKLVNNLVNLPSKRNVF